MEERKVLNLIYDYFEKNKFFESSKTLVEESGIPINKDIINSTFPLQHVLDEYENSSRINISLPNALLLPGDNTYINKASMSLNYITEGENILSTNFSDDRDLILGTAKGKTILIKIPECIDGIKEEQLILNANTYHNHKGGVLDVDINPCRRLFLSGGMDRKIYLTELSYEDKKPLQEWSVHNKYVVRVRWAPSGKSFISGSYDNSVNFFREDKTVTNHYYNVKALKFGGSVEAVCFLKNEDTAVISIRNDHRLHIFNCDDDPYQTRCINMNAIGDNFVSFTAMDICVSPDNNFVTVATDTSRIILYEIKTGQQLLNFYGATNDGFSQPRHCWHPDGHYLYSTSQDNCIYVWEISTQQIVSKLKVHTNVVRHISISDKLKILVSGGYDATAVLWKRV
ncbi:Protein will die slowly [Trichoplax sp. H2]|nr:Protein will die slowly [Trichoplax sp. H2]|eukprot:RDD41147.1 Protein will die slowly [Trichoplax sp. H2]